MLSKPLRNTLKNKLYLTTALVCSIIAVALLHATQYYAQNSQPQWNQQERTQLLQFSLVNATADPSNAYQNDPMAIKLGQLLFHDARLSKNARISCSSCHSEKHWMSTPSNSPHMTHRQAPSLYNIAAHEWYGWDGQHDSLWAQSMHPFELDSEHAMPRSQVVQQILNQPKYKKMMAALGVNVSPLSDSFASPKLSIEAAQNWQQLTDAEQQRINHTFSVIGKALAAYIAQLKAPARPFDRFLQSEHKGERDNPLSPAALHGLKLFMGKAQCSLCHTGKHLSTANFFNIGTGSKIDRGRSDVLSKIKSAEFGCRSEYSSAKPQDCDKLRYSNYNYHHNLFKFKTPSLRGIKFTAPYMHDGRYNSLSEVINHYTSNQASDTDLPEIKLTVQEKQALEAFLGTL